MMETVYITAGFAWKPEAHVDTKHVELLISKAEDIYQDHFDNNDVLIHSVKYSTYNLEQWNADGGSFCVCPSLEPGVYQFVFRVDNGEEKQLKISDYYEQTFLGNGRAVNYIELNMAYGNTNQRKLIRSYGDLSNVTSTSCERSHLDKKSNINNRSSGSQRHKSCTLL
ncbi:hypothetical protein OS493_026447 [Desmophyllum pertusum]|uniref:Uncharacterized protein n=1 Tax=Desmophyllum pertusum TaxID=174260 RepID=A0A9W9YXT8_9CNID|nr:hypothetical protein OS493_026447 [Desmophyllum pertusum]